MDELKFQVHNKLYAPIEWESFSSKLLPLRFTKLKGTEANQCKHPSYVNAVGGCVFICVQDVKMRQSKLQ